VEYKRAKNEDSTKIWRVGQVLEKEQQPCPTVETMGRIRNPTSVRVAKVVNLQKVV
jgi:hypothetical protein